MRAVLLVAITGSRLTGERARDARGHYICNSQIYGTTTDTSVMLLSITQIIIFEEVESAKPLVDQTTKLDYLL